MDIVISPRITITPRMREKLHIQLCYDIHIKRKRLLVLSQALSMLNLPSVSIARESITVTPPGREICQSQVAP